MFDKMKCKSKFDFIKNNFGVYQYLALKEKGNQPRILQK